MGIEAVLIVVGVCVFFFNLRLLFFTCKWLRMEMPICLGAFPGLPTEGISQVLVHFSLFIRSIISELEVFASRLISRLTLLP